MIGEFKLCCYWNACAPHTTYFFSCLSFFSISPRKETDMPSLSTIVNHPLFNVAFFMVIRQFTKKLPLDDPQWLWNLRAFFVVCQTLAIGLQFWLMWRVVKKNGKFISKA